MQFLLFKCSLQYWWYEQKDIQTQGLAVILASNPRNPTGQVSVFLFIQSTPHWTMSEGYQVNTLAISILVEPLTICRGNDLKELVSLGREGTTIILDEVSKPIFGLPMPFSLTYFCDDWKFSFIRGTYTQSMAMITDIPFLLRDILRMSMTCALIFWITIIISYRSLPGCRSYHRRPHQGDHNDLL